MRSPTLVSGVASFSPYRSLRCFQATGVRSPSAATSAWQRPHDGRVRVVVDLAAGDDRRPLVEQADEGADQAGLALPALAEQHEVVAGEQGALDLGDDGVVEADDAGQGRGAGGEAGDEVLADLGLDAAVDVPGGAQFAEGVDAGCRHPLDATTRPQGLGREPQRAVGSGRRGRAAGQDGGQPVGVHVAAGHDHGDLPPGQPSRSAWAAA